MPNYVHPRSPGALVARFSTRGIRWKGEVGSGRPRAVAGARRDAGTALAVDDISFRQRRYLLMMGIRAVLLVIAVVYVRRSLGWLVVIPAVGAIFIPYFAVVLANGGREPGNTPSFMEYSPKLPATRNPAGPRRVREKRPSARADRV